MRFSCRSFTCVFNVMVVVHFLFTAIPSLALMQPTCHDEERSALLQFKESFVSYSFASFDSCSFPPFPPWIVEGGQGNCCSWHGVECDSLTGYVVGLDLSSSCLYGSIDSNSSIFHLVHLRKLNLANNNFNHSKIPAGVGQLPELTYLNLSRSVFSDQIPFEISKLSKLSTLDLSDNRLELQNPNLSLLIQHLNHLERLQLDGVNISSTIPDFLANLSSLKTLHLSGCEIQGIFPEGVFHLPNLQDLQVASNPFLIGNLPGLNMSNSLESLKLCGTGFSGELPPSIGNLISLTMLDVASSKFSGLIPSEIGNLSQLTYLDLRGNGFRGQIPSSLEKLAKLQTLRLGTNNFGEAGMSWLGKQTKLAEVSLQGVNLTGTIPLSLRNLTQLKILDLQGNKLTGQIPSWLGNLTQLTSLDLRKNHFQDSVPKSLSNLVNLQHLYLNSNNLSGTLDFSMFLRLQNLERLHLSLNNLTILTKTSSMNASFPQFTQLGLQLCKLHEFPDFLRYQVQMKWLDLSENNIHHQIPRWLLEVSKDTLEALFLTNNFLDGFERPSLVLPFHRLIVLDLDNNRLQGEIPIPPPSIVFYKASNNSFNGEISPLICSLNSLVFLDLSYNNLHGSLPPCLGSYKNFGLTQSPPANTNFPSAIGNSPNAIRLRLINLSQNRLRGPLPKPLANCTTLEYFDMNNNQINDTFPFWLGTLPDLKVLRLHSNQFHGQLTRSSSNKNWFANLHIFDISDNQFHGYLGSDFFQGWSFMENITRGPLNYLQILENIVFEENLWWLGSYDWSMTIINKGSSINYQKTQVFFIFINLSCNKFEGKIPESIGNLRGVNSLNISNNKISGRIPRTIKNMTELESLDLSQNQLSGEIPPELADLNSLGTFKVSHNHLEGPIPRGGQFEAFPSYYFDGNPGLCGPPLSRKCKLSDESSNSQQRTIQEEEGDSDSRFSVEWKEVVVGYGFGVVIGITFGMIFTRKRRGWFEATFGTMRNQRRGRKPSSQRRRR